MVTAAGTVFPLKNKSNTVICLVSADIKKSNNDVETDLILSKTVTFEGLIKHLKCERFRGA